MKVCYLMSGPAHLPYLTVSLHTLRKHFNGPVEVYCYQQSFELGTRVCEHFNIPCMIWNPVYSGRQSQFINKVALLEQTNSPTLYLDADTSIHGPLDVIGTMLTRHGFLATQFNAWNTNSNLIRKRLERLREFSPDFPAYLDEVCQKTYPSVNGGVVATTPGSPVTKAWLEYCHKSLKAFIYDECILHLLQAKFPDPNDFAVILGGRYNCSPKYEPATLGAADVVIRHYHGDSNVRPTKSVKGINLWIPLFHEVLDQNIGGISEWWDKVANKYLNKYNPDQLGRPPMERFNG